MNALKIAVAALLSLSLTVLFAPIAQAEPRVIEIAATADDTFVPDTIKLSPGESVVFRVTAERGKGAPKLPTLHGFRVDKGDTILLNVPLKAEKGKDCGAADIPWTAPVEKGTYVLSCSFPCGPGHGGMKGELVVE